MIKISNVSIISCCNDIMANPLKNFTCVPKMVVFDLDYTLWPLWVDTDVRVPFFKDSAGNVFDRYQSGVSSYPGTLDVLKYLQENNIRMSVASRTESVEEAVQLIQIFGWNKYFENKQIYPGSKDTHITRISEASGIGLEQMLVFDNDDDNIVDLERLGVVSTLVENGMSMKVLFDGLKKFSETRMPLNNLLKELVL